MSLQSKVCVVVGVGPGIGLALSYKFALEGYTVCMVARRLSELEKFKNEVISSLAASKKQASIHAFSCDITEPTQVTKTFADITDKLGAPSVLLYNASARRFKPVPVHETDPEQLLSFWKIQCYGAFLCSRAVIGGEHGMLAKQSGTIIFTGATSALRAAPGLSTFSIGKFGLRALAQSLAREYQAKGLHIVHLILDGPVRSPIVEEYTRRQIKKTLKDSSVDTKDIVVPEGILMETHEIADQVWNLHLQPKSVWTHELDMRSMKEPIFSKL